MDFLSNSRLNAILRSWAMPFFLLGLTFLGYGLFSWGQGFHWDDWNHAWIPVTFGLPGLIRYYSFDRPLLAYLFAVTTSLIGPHPFAWQVFGMFWRWTSAVAVWWVMGIVRPDQKRIAFWVAVLFLFYPGFQQQSIPIAYGHYFLLETLFFVSLGLMLKATEQVRFRWLLLSLALLFAAMNLFMAEYFAGFEILRPILLWIFLVASIPDKRQRLKGFLTYYVPFVVLFALFFYWRFFIDKSQRYGIDVLGPSETVAISTLGQLAQTILGQWSTLIFNAWFQVFKFPDPESFGWRLIVLYALIMVGALEGLIYCARRLAPSDSGEAGDDGALRTRWRNSMPWVVMGIVAIFAAEIPFLAAGLVIKLQFPLDRFTMPSALGVALLLVGFIELLPSLGRRSVVAGLLAVLAIGFQIQIAFAFRSDWNSVKYYLWQLAWRMPGLQPGTVVLSTHLPIQYSSDNSMTAPLNWIYAPGSHAGSMPYMNMDIEVRTKSGTLNLSPDQPISIDFRAATFDSTTDHAVVLDYRPPGCVRVLNPQYDHDLLVASKSQTSAQTVQAPFDILPYLTAQAMPLSDMAQIIPNPSQPARPMDFLYPEPPHKWCYYFEKADLARQLGDWQTVAKIGDQAFSIPYYPDDLSEYLPFIEAYARLGRWQDARDLTDKTSQAMPLLDPELCSLWRRIHTVSLSSSDQKGESVIVHELNNSNCIVNEPAP